MLVGTSQSGWAVSDSGSGTLFTSEPSSSCGTLPFSRGSAKKSLLMLPVLVTLMVAVTGWSAGSTVPAEFGIPVAVTDGAVNESAPVNGSVRRAPLTGSATSSTRVHRPEAGEPWKNCIVGPGARLSLAVACASSGSPFGSIRNPSSP